MSEDLAAQLRALADQVESPDKATSPLITRVTVALMEMPDAEFLALANKVVGRYTAAMDDLAPPGHIPVSMQTPVQEES